MRFLIDLIEKLAANAPGGYSSAGEAASEPTALAAVALAAHGRIDAATFAAEWLVEQQSEAGNVGVSPTQSTPSWPTSLAILAWQSVQSADGSNRFAAAIDRGLEWAFHDAGETFEQQAWIGHDATLAGWSWTENTHSWLEPTAMFVLALKSVGQPGHPRTREAIMLLVDRLLPAGGCNYGNTTVLDQLLLPHVQPTGLVMMALAGEASDDGRIDLSLSYLNRELSGDTTTSSLCYGLLGLAAHGRSPGDRSAWLEAAYERELARGASCYKLALLALAAADEYPIARVTEP